MPITLVTGLPGHGKTLYTLARWKPEAEKAGRAVYHNNIPGLAIPGWQTCDVKEWQTLPPGSLFIVDEAQFAFPATGRGQTPDWVQQLATHRHLGLDFVVITQNPMLLDSFVRRLVDRHFHVVRKFGTSFATVYEFVNGAKEDVAKNRNNGIRHEFRYPRDVFAWYKSAEVHTVKARIPFRVYMLAVLPLLFFGLAYLAYSRLNPEARQAQINEQLGITGQAAKPSPGAFNPPGGGGQAEPPGRSDRMTPAQYVQAYTPRIEGLPHTAPIYDGATSPREAPYPAACLAAKTRCQCYTQQGTRLDMREALCREIAAGGFFVAWQVDGGRVQQTPPVQAGAAAQQPAQLAAAGGFHAAQAPRFTPGQAEPDAGSLPRRVRRATGAPS